MHIWYIIYSFSTTIGLHVCGSWNIFKQKKLKRIMQFPSLKSPPLWYSSGFFPIRMILLCIYSKMQNNTHFLNEISSKNFKSLNGPRFNSCISISYTKNISPKNSTHNPNFEVYMQFFQTLWHVLFCHKYIPYIQVFHFLFDFLKNWLD
jgi:hypothetical protein